VEAALKQKLQENLKQAMRNRDRLRSSVIRLILAGIKNAEIAKREVLNDADILGIITKEVRQRKESILAFRQGNRQDLVDIEEAEMAILAEYLPEQMSREDIVTAVGNVIKEIGAQGLRDKGKVMARLMPQLKGKADGRDINAVATELLG
jgi:uncharacterized protein YqeY